MALMFPDEPTHGNVMLVTLPIRHGRFARRYILLQIGPSCLLSKNNGSPSSKSGRPFRVSTLLLISTPWRHSPTCARRIEHDMQAYVEIVESATL